MLIQLFEGLWNVLFNSKVKRSFETALISLVWAVTLFILVISIPHGADIIALSEHGDARDIKATILASVIEIVPALLILIGFHAKGLVNWQKQTLIGLATPFVLLTAHIQFSFYAGEKLWPIYPIELALILPYGVCVCAVSVSFLWPLVSQATAKIQEALDAVEAKWRIILSDKDQELAELGKERDSARQELWQTSDNARQVIGKLEKELSEKQQELTHLLTIGATHSGKALPELREQLVRLGKARLNENQACQEVDKLLAEWEGESE